MTSTYQRALDLSERPDKSSEITAFIRHVLGYKFGSPEFIRAQSILSRGSYAVERHLKAILCDDDE